MKRSFLALSAASIAFVGLSPAIAQDDGGTETAVESPDGGNGAIVTREELTEPVLDENGEPVPALDENNEPVLDADGNPIFETVAVGFSQTVETPSGNIHTITKEEGSRAIVTHEFANRPERVARAERPERPEKPEKPERPERPERPDKPGRP